MTELDANSVKIQHSIESAIELVDSSDELLLASSQLAITFAAIENHAGYIDLVTKRVQDTESGSSVEFQPGESKYLEAAKIIVGLEYMRARRTSASLSAGASRLATRRAR